jgi:multisubunit Na+/H+ antiporter MnhB subunit
MFLDWYRLDLPERIGTREIDVPTYNAFELLERSDVILVVTAVLALVFAGILLARALQNSPAPGLALLGAGVFALGIVIYRGTNAPDRLVFGESVDSTLRFGWFVALVSAAVLAVGGLLAYLAGPRLVLEADEFEDDEEQDTQRPPAG